MKCHHSRGNSSVKVKKYCLCVTPVWIGCACVVLVATVLATLFSIFILPLLLAVPDVSPKSKVCKGPKFLCMSPINMTENVTGNYP